MVRQADVALLAADARLADALPGSDIARPARGADRVTVARLAAGASLNVPEAFFAPIAAAANHVRIALALAGVDVALLVSRTGRVAVANCEQRTTNALSNRRLNSPNAVVDHLTIDRLTALPWR